MWKCREECRREGKLTKCGKRAPRADARSFDVKRFNVEVISGRDPDASVSYCVRLERGE